tara:strand:- start:10590 stop:10892 length:303 start_codon:yes stop_codon:yes gene_type:complete
MKELICTELSQEITFEIGKIYKLNKLIPFDQTNFYTFKFSAEISNALYGTCKSLKKRVWEFERYPDKETVYVIDSCANDSFKYGIIEFNSEDELLIEGIK